MWLINLAMMNFNFDFLRNDTNGVFDKVLYHKVSCLFISSEPCLFIIKLWNCSTATQFSRSDEMNDVLTWSWFQRKEWSSQLNSIQRNCTKKNKKKKGLKKFGPHLGSDASKFPSGQMITGTGIWLNLTKAWIYQNSL